MQGPSSLKQLEAFRAVMLTGTTVQAADMLHVTQPAISRYLQNLEFDVGFALFERRQGRLHPTSEGEALFAEVENTFAGLDRLRRVAEDIRLLRRGHLRLVVPMPLARWLLPQALADFRADYPEITVTLDIAVRRELKPRVDAQQFDLAFATLPFDYAGSEVSPFVKVNGVCVLPAGHRLRKLKVVHAEDLAEDPYISLSPDTLARYRIDRAFEEASVHRNLAIETQTGSSICELVAAGLGVAVVDPFTASSHAKLGICARPFRPAVTYEYGMLYPAQRPRSQLAEAFAAIVRDCAAKHRKMLQAV
ncbi:MAG: LysR substrate-binding domain-containing protein [Alphaproteobacteria bacterium]|nr:LysR substrate-binding domain-containing protein [Alphaproteobacteria bacterium]